MHDMLALDQEIESLGLTDFHAVKTILHVNELSQLYEMAKLGKMTEALLNELCRFQILNPRATKEDAASYMLEKKEEFLVKHKPY